MIFSSTTCPVCLSDINSVLKGLIEDFIELQPVESSKYNSNLSLIWSYRSMNTRAIQLAFFCIKGWRKARLFMTIDRLDKRRTHYAAVWLENKPKYLMTICVLKIHNQIRWWRQSECSPGKMYQKCHRLGDRLYHKRIYPFDASSICSEVQFFRTSLKFIAAFRSKPLKTVRVQIISARQNG